MGEVRVRLQEIIDDPAPAQGAPPSASSARGWKIAAITAAAVAVSAFGYAVAARPKPVVVVAPSLTRLTWDGGLTTSPSVSRDGTLLAYASDRAGRGDLDIWLERLGAGDPIRLTTDAADDSAPDISPDGTRVAFRSERNGGGVYVVPSFGGADRLIAPGCHDPKYSPDGNWIACWTGDVGGAFYAKAARIWLVPASGGPMQPFRPDFDTAAFPLWMPDSNGLLFLGREAGAKGLDAVDWWIAAEQGTPHAMGATRPFFRNLGLSPGSGSYWIHP